MKKSFLLKVLNTVSILTIIGGTLSSSTWAMDTPGNQEDLGEVVPQKTAISKEIKDQVKNVKKWAEDLKQRGEAAYLVVGSANDEIAALKDQTQAHKWAFWNLSGSEGGKSVPSVRNPFIDADFNNKEIHAYVSKEL